MTSTHCESYIHTMLHIIDQHHCESYMNVFFSRVGVSVACAKLSVTGVFITRILCRLNTRKKGRRSRVLLLNVRLRPLAPAWSSRRKLERASQHRTDHDCKNGRVCACGGLRKKLRIYKNTCMTLYVCVKDASCDIESIKWTHISHQLQNRRTCATCDNMHRDRWSRLQER